MHGFSVSKCFVRSKKQVGCIVIVTELIFTIKLQKNFMEYQLNQLIEKNIVIFTQAGPGMPVNSAYPGLQSWSRFEGPQLNLLPI